LLLDRIIIGEGGGPPLDVPLVIIFGLEVILEYNSSFRRSSC
jgi:hypothetical protein